MQENSLCIELEDFENIIFSKIIRDFVVKVVKSIVTTGETGATLKHRNIEVDKYVFGMNEFTALLLVNVETGSR